MTDTVPMELKNWVNVVALVHASFGEGRLAE